MGFFNDIVNWVDNNITKPVGNWWENDIKKPTGEWVVKTFGLGSKYDEATKPITDTVKQKLEDIQINNNPFLTEEEKKELKNKMEEIETNTKPPKTTEEQEQNKGNLQETENTQNTPTIEELWEREDKIRKETQEREDTAYQRAVEDMRKAGINPNLAGVNPASSGGGIIQATGQQSLATEMSGIIQQAIAEINNTVKADENQKDRINDIIKSFAQVIAMKILLKK